MYLFNIVCIEELEDVVELAFNRTETGFDVVTTARFARTAHVGWTACPSKLRRSEVGSPVTRRVVRAETVAAFHWASFAWKKRHLAWLAALAADGVMQFAWRSFPSAGAVPGALFAEFSVT